MCLFFPLPFSPSLFLSECPEEVYDPRSLYERLQEQKDRKQQEYEEQFKFSKLQKTVWHTLQGLFDALCLMQHFFQLAMELSYLVPRCSFDGKETTFCLLEHNEHFCLELKIPILILC